MSASSFRVETALSGLWTAERFVDSSAERPETQVKMFLQMGMIEEHVSGKKPRLSHRRAVRQAAEQTD